jgi:hypothetical protein
LFFSKTDNQIHFFDTFNGCIKKSLLLCTQFMTEWEMARKQRDRQTEIVIKSHPKVSVFPRLTDWLDWHVWHWFWSEDRWRRVDHFLARKNKNIFYSIFGKSRARITWLDTSLKWTIFVLHFCQLKSFKLICDHSTHSYLGIWFQKPIDNSTNK